VAEASEAPAPPPPPPPIISTMTILGVKLVGLVHVPPVPLKICTSDAPVFAAVCGTPTLLKRCQPFASV
jgi:hypothetical protein